jgi:hypothetical protein
MRFVADSMLGRLAKWLRAFGYDTHYQPRYSEEALASLVGEGRVLLTRKKKALARHPSALWIRSDHVSEQLAEVQRALALRPERSLWFTRCLRCNAVLTEAGAEEARAQVPEHVFHESALLLRLCPRCGRHYWPGSHRANMLHQMESWSRRG